MKTSIYSVSRFLAVFLFLSQLLPQASAGTSASGLLYYTRYQSPPEVKHVNYYYDGGTNIIFTNAVSIATLNAGSDGLTVGPDGDLIVGACSSGTIYKVHPSTGAFASVTSGGGSCHVSLDPNHLRAWAGISYSGSFALSEIPIAPNFTNGIAHTITGSENGVGSLAWDPAGNVYYTISQPAGTGNFGTINLTTFVTTRFLTGIPAAHGMAYDPFSGTFLLFGSTHITQVMASPSGAVIIGDVTVPGASTLDQGAVDGRGHIFVADNGGRIVFMDYSGSGSITNATTFVAAVPFDSYLDDLAPIGLVGSGALADLGLTVQTTPPAPLPGHNVVLTMTVTNAGPAGATNLTVTDTLPPNAVYGGATTTLGTVGVVNGLLTCTVPTLNAGSAFTLTVNLRAVSGYLTNRAIVISDQSDLYFPNNIADSVISVADSCLPPPRGIAGWWTADGTTNDFASTNNGALANPTHYSPGKVGQAFSFDGVTDYMIVTNEQAFHFTNLTFECWASFNRYDRVSTLVSKAYGGGDQDSFTVWLQNGSLNGYCQFANNSAEATLNNFNPIPGAWYHIGFTYDSTSGAMILYVNGLPAASANLVGTITYDTHALLIGADYANNSLNYLMSGLIDEPTLYNRALSAAEIQSIYFAGVEGKCSTPVITPAVLPPAATNRPYSEQISLAHATPNFTFQQVNGAIPPGMALPASGLLSGAPTIAGTYNFTEKGTDASNQVGQALLTLTVDSAVPPPTGLLAWWRGEGNALDELGYHNGTLNGGVSFTNGVNGQAFVFDGNSGYVNSGAWTAGSRWTLEAWVNPATQPNQREAILGVFANCFDWGLSILNGQLGVNIRQPGGCGLFISSGIYPQVGVWYHLVATCDGTNTLVYVNGALKGSGTSELNYIGDSSSVRIGNDICCGDYFAGMVDEPRIYNRPLTASEIATEYNAGPAGGLPVGPGPVISSQPSNTTAAAFSRVVLCATATGPGPLTYQWYKNSVPISGATDACLTFPDVAYTDAGLYSITVGNASGTTISSAATLTVIDLKLYAGITINGIVGANYRIEYTTSLASTPVWTTLTTLTLPTNPYIYIDTTTPATTIRYYRVTRIP